MSNHFHISQYRNYVTIITIIIILLAMGWVIFFTQVGIYEAKNRAWLAVTETAQPPNQELAIIRIYGDNIYAVPFTHITRKSNEDNIPAPFERKLFILKTSDVKLPLTYKQVGPLKPKEAEAKPEA